jgi:hypothetical protein
MGPSSSPRNLRQSINSKISFTFDAGTSHNHQPFLAVAGHWIDSQWVLNAQTLAFLFLKKHHTAKNIARVLASVLHSNNILGKLGTGVNDNIELSSAVMRHISKYVSHISGEVYDAVKRHGR